MHVVDSVGFAIAIGFRWFYHIQYHPLSTLWWNCPMRRRISIRVTSHMRLRANDHYTSNTLIGGKGGASPSSLHTTLEGPTEYVNARWTVSLHGFPHGIKWIVFHNQLDYFQKLPLEGRPYTKPGDRGTLNAHNHRFILFYHVRDPAWIKKFIEIAFGWGPGHMWFHTTLEGPWPHYMIWEVSGTAFGHFLLGSHDFMVTALGSCVKWPIASVLEFRGQGGRWCHALWSSSDTHVTKHLNL